MRQVGVTIGCTPKREQTTQSKCALIGMSASVSAVPVHVGNGNHIMFCEIRMEYIKTEYISS